MRAACCSAVFTGTNRIVGRLIASQIASASAASFLPRLTYGLASCGAISFTSCPNDCSRRAQWCEPPQASRATTVGGSLPKKVIRSWRRSLLRRTGSSAAFTPCSWKTCFDVSIPMRIIWSMDGLLCLRSATTSFWHSDAVRGPSTPTDLACRGGVQSLGVVQLEGRSDPGVPPVTVGDGLNHAFPATVVDMNPKREGLPGAADGDLEPEVVPITRASQDEVFRREPGPKGRLLQLAG